MRSNANIQIKPINKQIIIYHPLKRLELDITSITKLDLKLKVNINIYFA